MKSVVSIVLSAHVSMCSGDAASVKTFEILSFQLSDDKLSDDEHCVNIFKSHNFSFLRRTISWFVCFKWQSCII